MAARNLQLETMRLYRALADRREDWRSQLVLLTGAACASTGAPAVSIAGGTSLALDSDAAQMKAALRAGHLDFVVNSLDEALRALKNEVRQKRALSVGLIADVNSTLAEIDQRGVAPDLRLESASPHAVARSDESFLAASAAATLREIDTALLAAIPPDDLIRRRWIERAPQFLREARTGGRWIWLSNMELAMLAARGLTPEQLP